MKTCSWPTRLVLTQAWKQTRAQIVLRSLTWVVVADPWGVPFLKSEPG